MLHQLPVGGMDRFHVHHGDADLRQQSGDGETVLVAYQCMSSSSKTRRPLNLARRNKGIVSRIHSHTYIMPNLRDATARCLTDIVCHHLVHASQLSIVQVRKRRKISDPHSPTTAGGMRVRSSGHSTRLSVFVVRISISQQTNNLANLWKAMYDDGNTCSLFL